MPGEHALLSPSSASRWMACTPSARVEEKLPDNSGEAAQEGSLAHTLGELMLRRYIGEISTRKYNSEVKKIQADGFYSPDMLQHCEDYTAFVVELFEQAKKRSSDAIMAIEVKLDLTAFIPEGFGTGDDVIIADGILDITDLKYGQGVPVSCVQNKQMMTYALGALQEYDYLYDIHTVRMNIFQPRLNNISSYEMLVKDLKAWGENELKVKAKQAFAGEGEFVPGDHCRFCRAKTRCRALAEKNLEIAKYEFQDPAFLTDEEISDILTRSDLFTNWINSIGAFALTEAVDHGKKWPGYKLVEGKSNRVYSDQDKVAKTLKTAGYEDAIIYERKLLGITAMEKAITKKQFSALLDNLVIKPQGKPVLVPESDKRPELSSTENAMNDFAESVN